MAPAPHHGCDSFPSSVKLIAANGLPLTSFGSVSRKIKIGSTSYIFSFIYAKIQRPILGIDFFQKFGMTLDFWGGKLNHPGKQTRFTNSTSNIASVNLVKDPLGTISNILNEFPELTNVALAARSDKLGVECHIPTTGSPVVPRQDG